MAWDSDGSFGSLTNRQKPGLPQAGFLVVAGFGQPPRPRFPDQVVAAVVGHHDLLTEPIVALGSSALALAAPHADQRQQREQRIVQVGALAQVRGVGGDRQIGEHRDVARGRHLGPFGRGGNRPVARTAGDGAFVRGHDSSVMSRYSAYSANQVMTTTAATSRSLEEQHHGRQSIGGPMLPAPRRGPMA